MDGLGELGPWGVGLVALRWWALLAVQAWWRAAVGRVWLVVAAGLAVALATAGRPGVSVVETAMETGMDPWSAAGLELGLGALVGLVVALPGHALIGAADTSAQVLRTATAPWRALTLCLVAATLLTLGLHRPLLVGASLLFETWPVGEPSTWVEGASAVSLGQLAHGLAVVALTLATPALLTGAVVELAVGLAPRGSPAPFGLAGGLGASARAAAVLVATGASWAAYDLVWAERAMGL